MFVRQNAFEGLFGGASFSIDTFSLRDGSGGVGELGTECWLQVGCISFQRVLEREFFFVYSLKLIIHIFSPFFFTYVGIISLLCVSIKVFLNSKNADKCIHF